MNFFERELKKITDKSNIIKNVNFIGHTCIFRLTDIVTAKIEIAEFGTKDNYPGLRVSLINRTSGIIDTQKIHFSDAIGRIAICGEERNPYIWDYRNDPEWYGFKPTNEHYTRFAMKIDEYLTMFTDPTKPKGKRKLPHEET